VPIEPRYVNTSPIGKRRNNVGHALLIGQGDHVITSLRFGSQRLLEDPAEWLVKWLRRGNPNDLVFTVSQV
jgi:hypothetical protein